MSNKHSEFGIKQARGRRKDKALALVLGVWARRLAACVSSIEVKRLSRAQEGTIQTGSCFRARIRDINATLFLNIANKAGACHHDKFPPMIVFQLESETSQGFGRQPDLVWISSLLEDACIPRMR